MGTARHTPPCQPAQLVVLNDHFLLSESAIQPIREFVKKRTNHSATACLIFAAIAVTMALAAGAAAAGSALYALTQAESAFDTMGSGGDEWSGATHNPDRNVLLVVDDENIGYEFALGATGEVDADVPVRVMKLDLGRNDIEGVAWISGETYAFLSEGTGDM